MILYIILGILLLIIIPVYFLAKKENKAMTKSYLLGRNEGYEIGFEEGESKEYKDGYREGFNDGYDKAKNEYRTDY